MTITYFFCSVLMLEMNSISSKDIHVHIFTCSENGDKSANEMRKCQNPQKLIFFRSPSLALQMYWARDRLLNVTSKYRKLNCWTHFMLSDCSNNILLSV